MCGVYVCGFGHEIAFWGGLPQFIGNKGSCTTFPTCSGTLRSQNPTMYISIISLLFRELTVVKCFNLDLHLEQKMVLSLPLLDSQLSFSMVLIFEHFSQVRDLGELTHGNPDSPVNIFLLSLRCCDD